CVRLEVGPGGEVAQGRRLGNLDARVRAPPGRRVAGPCGRQRDNREQHDLDDLDDAGMPAAVPAVPVAFFPILVPLAVMLMLLFSVLMQLLAGLNWVKS